MVGLLTDDLLLVMNEEKREKLIKWLTVENDLQIIKNISCLIKKCLRYVLSLSSN